MLTRGALTEERVVVEIKIAAVDLKVFFAEHRPAFRACAFHSRHAIRPLKRAVFSVIFKGISKVAEAAKLTLKDTECIECRVFVPLHIGATAFGTSTGHSYLLNRLKRRPTSREAMLPTTRRMK